MDHESKHGFHGCCFFVVGSTASGGAIVPIYVDRNKKAAPGKKSVHSMQLCLGGIEGPIREFAPAIPGNQSFQCVVPREEEASLGLPGG